MDLSLPRPARTAARGVCRVRGPHRAATEVRHIDHRASARNHHQPGVFPLQASTQEKGLDHFVGGPENLGNFAFLTTASAQSSPSRTLVTWLYAASFSIACIRSIRCRSTKGVTLALETEPEGETVSLTLMASPLTSKHASTLSLIAVMPATNAGFESRSGPAGNAACGLGVTSGVALVGGAGLGGAAAMGDGAMVSTASEAGSGIDGVVDAAVGLGVGAGVGLGVGAVVGLGVGTVAGLGVGVGVAAAARGCWVAPSRVR